MTSPARVGKYIVRSQLGKGGMGSVYHAYDPVARREVALKVLHPELVNDYEFLRRFQQESRVMMGMHHRNIIEVYDHGCSGGVYYIAMELITGPSLSDLLRGNRRLPLRDIVRIVQQIAAGLAHAHNHRLVHRDVKPGNILIDSATGEAKLGDFGVARPLDALPYTTLGMRLGTPEYMPPEQICGQATPESDQYALAVLAYRMLAGKLPFTGRTDMTVITKQMTQTPPFAADLRGVPRLVVEVLARALDKAPERRYASITQFAQALSEVEASSPRPIPDRPRVVQSPRAQGQAPIRNRRPTPATGSVSTWPPTPLGQTPLRNRCPTPAPERWCGTGIMALRMARRRRLVQLALLLAAAAILVIGGYVTGGRVR